MKRTHCILMAALLIGVLVMITAINGGDDVPPIPHIIAFSPSPTQEGPSVATPKPPLPRISRAPAGGCKQLPINSTFAHYFENAELCYDEGSCEGSIRVVIRGCEVGAPTTLSSNATLSEELRAFGPDAIRVRVAGPEVVGGLATVSGKCQYTYPLRLGTAGFYNIAAERLYAQHQGLNEAFSQWPELLKQSILPIDPPASNYHYQQRTLESTVSLLCVSPSHKDISDLLPCTGLEPTSGRWVERTGDGSVSTRVRVKKIQRSPIVFQWAIQPERPYVWVPDSCTRSSPLTTLIERTAARFEGKRVVVVGDSQMRALYFGLVNVLKGVGTDCVRNLTSIEREPSQCTPNIKGNHKMSIQGLSVDFYDDLFLEKLASTSKFDKYDVVIAGFAQHPASKEHWPLDRYRGALQRRQSKLEAIRKKGAMVVWYLSPQYPHTRQGYPVVVKDWRTDPRLGVFNGYAHRAMLGVGIPVLDGYTISSPMAHTSPDQAHFSNFVSFEIISTLLQILTA